MTTPLIPDWLPEELREYAAECFEEPDDSIEKRILIDPRMNEVWPLFNSLPTARRKKEMVRFLDTLASYRREGERKRFTQKERNKIRDLKMRISRQVRNLLTTIADVGSIQEAWGQDLWKTESNELEKHLRDIESQLLHSLEHHVEMKKTGYAPILFDGDFSTIETNKKLGANDAAEVYTREAVSIHFKKLFGNPKSRLATIVSFVAAGVPTPANKTSEQLRDSARKRISNRKRTGRS